MTLNSCRQAHATATGRQPKWCEICGSWEDVPAPGPLWLADIAGAGDHFEYTAIAPERVRVTWGRNEDDKPSGYGPDLYRATCAAVNGSPCEKKP